MQTVVHLSISIQRKPSDVYEFASDATNLPKWAAGLARSDVVKDGDGWIVQAPFGQARVTFVPRNSLGVMDHEVRLESGVVVNNPMRVVPNGDGSEFIFSLFRQAGMSEAEFQRDQAAVAADLEKIKEILEGAPVGAPDK